MTQLPSRPPRTRKELFERVRPLKGNGPAPYWSHDNLIATAGAKLRRLLLVKGERNKRSVRVIDADAYETFHLADIIYELMRRPYSPS